jgi:hypothetical protein
VGLLLLQLTMFMSRLHFASCAIQHRSPIGYGSIDVNIIPFSSSFPYFPCSSHSARQAGGRCQCPPIKVGTAFYLPKEVPYANDQNTESNCSSVDSRHGQCLQGCKQSHPSHFRRVSFARRCSSRCLAERVSHKAPLISTTCSPRDRICATSQVSFPGESSGIRKSDWRPR